MEIDEMLTILSTYGETRIMTTKDDRITPLYYWTIRYGIDGITLGSVKTDKRDALEFLYQMVRSKMWDECH